MTDMEKLLRENAEYVEGELDRRLSPELLGNGAMADAMRYATLGGGKRIRAFLTIEFCRMFGGKREDAAAYACAIEMIHAYSLIHDDLPCMDNADMRRGKPACHVQFGEETALLAGDSLLTYAFENAVLDYSSSDRMNRYAVYELAHGAGALGMCGGQELDLELSCPDYEELKRMHSLKTGALIRTASLLGYYAAVPCPESDVRDKICSYATALGLAFQITDDLLDARSTQDVLGKPCGSDARNGKKTVLSFMTEQEAEREALRLSHYAADVFAEVPRSEILCDLPLYLCGRKK